MSEAVEHSSSSDMQVAVNTESNVSGSAIPNAVQSRFQEPNWSQIGFNESNSDTLQSGLASMTAQANMSSSIASESLASPLRDQSFLRVAGADPSNFSAVSVNAAPTEFQTPRNRRTAPSVLQLLRTHSSNTLFGSVSPANGSPFAQRPQAQNATDYYSRASTSQGFNSPNPATATSSASFARVNTFPNVDSAQDEFESEEEIPSPKRKRNADGSRSLIASPQRISSAARQGTSNSASQFSRRQRPPPLPEDADLPDEAVEIPLPINDGSTVLNGLLRSPVLQMDDMEDGLPFLHDLPPGDSFTALDELDHLDLSSEFLSFMNGYAATFPTPSWEDIRNVFAVKYNLNMGTVTSMFNDMNNDTWKTIRAFRKAACSNNSLYRHGYYVHDLIGTQDRVHVLSLIRDLARKSFNYMHTGLRFVVDKIFWNADGRLDVSLFICLWDKDNLSRLYQDEFRLERGNMIEFQLHLASGNIRSNPITFPRMEMPLPCISFKARNDQFYVPFNYFSDEFLAPRERPIVSEFLEDVSRIKLVSMDSITEFFSMIINKKGKCIIIRFTPVLDALSLYFKSLLDEFVFFFDAFCTDPSPSNKSSMYKAFIFLNTIPTYLMLFPENKWNKLNAGQLCKYMANRWTAFLRIRNLDEPILEIKNDDFFNKPRTFNYSRKSSVKAAVKAASECLLSKSYDILNRAFNTTPPLEPSADIKYEELKKLHPLCNDLQFFVENNGHHNEEDSQVHFLDNEVIDFFKKAKEKGASPGPDGLSAETILMLILHNGDQSNSFLKSLCQYFDRLIHMKIPKDFWKILTSARLFGITKSDGVSQRPLANGLLFRKAIGSIALQKFSRDITKVLGPHQLGIAVTLGTEKIGHIFDHIFEDPNAFIMKTDFTNAFNSFKRSAALEDLFAHIPKLGSIVYKFYGVPNTLLYDNMEPITVNMGSQQGCPLGPLLFCFAFKPILEKLTLEYPECFLKAYIDDVTIAVKKNDIGVVSRILRSFETMANSINLKLNKSKCQLLVPDQIYSEIQVVSDLAKSDLQEAIRSENLNRAYQSTLSSLNQLGFIEENIVFNNNRESADKIGLEILGFPIGTKAYKSAFIDKIIIKYIKEAGCIRKLHHYQSEWSLFLYCLQSKLSYLLRVVHPDITIPLLGKLMQFDTKLLMSIFDLNGLNNDLKQQISTQFMFKVSEGGFNKKNYNHTAVAAYLGSSLTSYSYVKNEVRNFSPLLNDSEWLVNSSKLLFNFRKISDGADIAFPLRNGHLDHIGHIESFLNSLTTADHQGSFASFTFKKLQKRFSEVLYQRITKNFERLPEGGNGNATARTNQFYSGKWLLLSPAPSTYIENAVFRIAIALKLNLDLIPRGHKCFHCKSAVDPKGHHFLSCNCAGLKQCHDNVRDVIAEFFRRLGYKVFVGELPINSLNGISPRNADEDLEVFRSTRTNINSNPSNVNPSTIGTRVDILATKPGTNEKPIYMDVQVINSVAPSFVSLEAKETMKEDRHKAAVEAQHGEYWAPTFDCFGNPSKKSEKMFKSLYESYLASLPSNAKDLMVAEGRQINYWLTKISFSINHMKAYKTLMLLNDMKGNIMGKVNPMEILEHQSAQMLMRQASI